jgi:glycosyltransferase involved in cell wall biosynthesis
MRITFILPTVDMGGGTRVVAVHAKNLMRLGHSVRIISPPPRSIRIGRKVKSLLKEGRWLQPPTKPLSHLDNSGVEHQILDHWRPVTDDDVPDGDLVIATWWETAEWVSALSPSKGAKVYFIQHHEIFPYLPVARCHATYRLPMRKIVIARWLREVMHRQYSDDSVDLVPNSVDRSQFFAPPRGKQLAPTVGFLYSKAPFKGVDVTLAALQTVCKRIPGLRIVCFGSQQPTADLALPEHAEFFQLPAQDEIRNLYGRCDVWVTASRSEGFNLPAMEAMACRTPVVATRTGWPEEAIVTGRNGVLLDVDDVSGLAQGVEWILSRSDGEWRELSSNAYTTASAGSWEESTRLLEKALVGATERHSDNEAAAHRASRGVP